MNRKERTVFVTLLVNALVIGFKFWLAAASGSLSLRASAIQSVADAATGVLVLIGLFLTRGDASRGNFQSDIKQFENWVAIGVAAALFYGGFDIVREVLLREPPTLTNVGPAALAALVTIPVAYVLARYEGYVGRQTNSPALIAGGYHAQLDIYASIVVVAGLGGAALGLPGLDRAAAAVVVVFVLFSGWEIVASARRGLKRKAPLDVDGGPPVASAVWRGFAPVAAVLLTGLYLLSGFFFIEPGEIGVVRRFGRVIDANAAPGLHYRVPWPVDRADAVAVNAVRRAETPANLMLTGDENLITVRLSLHYRVSDPAAYLLNTAAPDALVAQAGESAMRQVVAQEGVDALLTVDRAAVQNRAAALAQSALDGYRVGLTVLSVQLLESSPPPDVADAFRDVASAREDRNTFINEARAYQNEIVPVARGDAEAAIQAANGYRSEKLAQATGDAALFTSRQSAYAKAPGVTRIRLYLEEAEKVLPGARKFIIDSAVRLQTTDLWLPGAGGAQTFPPQP
ncbi:MAG: FtsH protease activity modulator HflK [Chloroflexi bacterium]|nr:FtsH protease activity modulator HflK [Chloroflexota bacterium]